MMNYVLANNKNKLVFRHLNVNSICNKFELLSEQVNGNIDILMISETKVDDRFHIGNLLIHSFSNPNRADRDPKGINAIC